jgi:hypothetical protein
VKFSFTEALARLADGEIVRPVLMDITGVPNLGVHTATDADGNLLESAPFHLCRSWSDGTTSPCGCLLFRVAYTQCEWEAVPTLPNPGLSIVPIPEHRAYP